MLLNLQPSQFPQVPVSRDFAEVAHAANIGREFEADELGFQIKHLRDSGLKSRTAWLGKLLPGEVRGFEISPGVERERWSLRDESAILIIHGAVSARLGAVMQRAAPTFYDKVKIALLNESNPAKRAALLRCGYDDVFDMLSDHAECRARIRAHWRRYNLSRSVLTRTHFGLENWPSRLSRQYSPIVLKIMHDMTDREKELFKLMLENIDHVVPYERFVSALDTHNMKSVIRSLRVAICGIRAKVSHTFIVRSDTGSGYRMIVRASASQFWDLPG